MKKGRSVIGLPVLLEGHGYNLGKIVDILYTEKEGKLLGIMVETEETIPEMRFIYHDNLYSITDEAAFVMNKEVLQVPQCLKDYEVSCYSTALLFGQHIYNELGKEKGVISDVLLNIDENKVDGFVISNGFISDLVSGRDTIPVANVITMGKDMIIIKEDV